MRSILISTLVWAAISLSPPTCNTAVAADDSFQILFNGNDLAGWSGDMSLWSAVDGTIVGQTVESKPIAHNTFLVWDGGEVSDFEFRCKVRFDGNNTGVQYRSELSDPDAFIVSGYQADLHESQDYFGMLYGERMGDRGIIATRGQQLRIDANGSKQILSKLPPGDDLIDNQWNDLRIIAVGNRVLHQINGITTVDVTDDLAGARRSGILALQLHAGSPMKCEFRNLLLRPLTAQSGSQLFDSIDRERVASEATAAASVTASRSSIADILTRDPVARWIWSDETHNDQRLFFRHTLELDQLAESAWLYTTCDNSLELWINGQRVGNSNDWAKPIDMDVTKFLKVGKNVIAASCQNEGGVAAFVLKLIAAPASGSASNSKDTNYKTLAISDKSWRSSATATDGWMQPTFDDSAWAIQKTVELGRLGVPPWRIPKYDDSTASGDPLHEKNVLTPPGFAVERLYSVPSSQGSWVCLTTDPRGGFFASDQGDKGLFHIEVVDGKTVVEPIVVKDPDNGQTLSSAQGLVWAFDSLWMHRNGGHLYRIRDTDGDGSLDSAERYPSETGGGEHGNHAVIVSEDGKAIYMAGGNHAKLAALDHSRVPSWDEDHLLPRMSDANGHARGVMAPGGWVTRLDPASKQQELICIGFRNEYDIDLNRFGDMFTFDADMEWDMGLPWYRPTRICLVASGGDYGWRNGSGKWPAYYEDSLPPVVDIGPGSPTGVVMGTNTKFPTRYQDSLFALDWTFGTIYSVHLQPAGAGYTGVSEPFIYASPLPVTDAIVGDEGDMYFTVGGRGTDSAFYRVRYIGNESIAKPRTGDDDADAQNRATRRQLESFHGRVDDRAVATAWPHLSSRDRFLRSAARIAIESQPTSQWASKIYSEPDRQSRITAAVALARTGTHEHLAPLLSALLEINPEQLDESQFLGLLRAYSLAFIRLGDHLLAAVDDELKTRIIAQLDPHLPNRSGDLNQELLSMLVYLQAPGMIAKAMELIEATSPPVIPDWEAVASRNGGYGASIQRMRENPPPTREIGYAFALRNAHSGWTLDQRRRYFEFLNRAAKGSGGASYPGYLNNIRAEVLADCTNEQRAALQDVTGENFNPVPSFPIAKPSGPGQTWTIDSALQAIRGSADFERGRSLFFGADCGKCHRLAGLGGGVGPDLTSIPNKFDERYVLESMVEPSKVISDQYGSSNVLMTDGRLLSGIVVPKDEVLEIYPIQATDEPIRVSSDDVESIEPSKISQMPTGLLDRLSGDELRDLVGYLMSGGDPKSRRYNR